MSAFSTLIILISFLRRYRTIWSSGLIFPQETTKILVDAKVRIKSFVANRRENFVFPEISRIYDDPCLTIWGPLFYLDWVELN